MPIIRAAKLGTISRYKDAKVSTGVRLSATDARDHGVGDCVVVLGDNNNKQQQQHDPQHRDLGRLWQRVEPLHLCNGLLCQV